MSDPLVLKEEPVSILPGNSKISPKKTKMALFGNIEPFVPSGDFEAYEERLVQFFLYNKVEEDKKVPLFITIMGPETYKILKSLLIPDAPSTKDFKTLLATLKAHFSPKLNKRSERFKFSKTVQRDGETITEFIIKLKAHAQSCVFGDYLDDALADKFIVGLRNENIQQALLNKGDVKFEDYCSVALNMEMSEKESKAIQPLPQYMVRTSNHRQKSPSMFKRSPHKRSQSPHPNKGNSSCNKCGRSHKGECPARNWRCFSCDVVGHTSKVCSKKGKKINKINSVSSYSEAAKVLVKIDDKELLMEVDTGACSSIISKDEYNSKFSHIKIQKCTQNFSTVTGQSIQIVGKIDVTVEFENLQYILELFIIEAEKAFNPLLGRDWLNALVPNWRSKLLLTSEDQSIKVVNDKNLLSEIKVKFPKIVSFEVDSSIENFTADIQLEENSVPIFHKAYSVPFKSKDKINTELDRLLSLKIIEPVRYSNWASPIVAVPKSNGDIRICVDAKVTINKYVKTEHYPLPRIDDIFASLAKCNYFCIIDLVAAYQQLMLSENSKEFLTINTHRGLFRYNRLAFGVSSAPSIFQQCMDSILVNMNKVACYLDDIIVGGISVEECKENLFLVLKRLNDHNVQINLEKSKMLETCVKYLGHTLKSNTISPNPDKIKALVDAPAPKDVPQLQSYLGLLNYYGKFIPNLSGELADLYSLLRKDVTFEWNEKQRLCFENSKLLIQKHNVLELYDPSKPLVVACDASPYGVGAILSQVTNGVEKPVLMGSSTLSPAERNFSQLHREALAIIFGIKLFHKYIYGHEFTICTDHQALREIFSPKKGTPSVAAARLQRWAVILSMYNYKIEYRKGHDMRNADALSRLPLSSSTNVDSGRINSLNLNDESCPIDVKKIQEHMKQDKVLSTVYDFIIKGWPNKIPLDLQPYYSKRNSLCTEDGCLYYMNRIVIPLSLQKDILKTLHDNHLGIVRMKMVARSYVWWYKIDQSIEEYVKGCLICQQTQNVPKEFCKTSWRESTYPFERVHVDFFYFEKYIFFLVVDTYSKHVDIMLVNSTSAAAVIEKLKKSFSIYGLFSEIVADNGPPYNSFEYRNFLKMNGVICTNSPPYHSQSNGSAERYVEEVKFRFHKFLLESKQMPINDKVIQFLIVHRNTPSTVTLKTPSEMIFAFKPKILLDLVNIKKKVSFDESKNQTIELNKNVETKKSLKIKNKSNEFKDKVIYKNFEEGLKVLYRNHFKNYIKWIPARILQKVSNTTYLINVNNNVRFVHENQIRISSLADEYHPSLRIVSQNENNETNVKSKDVPTTSTEIKSKESVSKNTSNTPIRRTKRIRYPVDRYTHYTGK